MSIAKLPDDRLHQLPEIVPTRYHQIVVNCLEDYDNSISRYKASCFAQVLLELIQNIQYMFGNDLGARSHPTRYASRAYILRYYISSQISSDLPQDTSV